MLNSRAVATLLVTGLTTSGRDKSSIRDGERYYRLHVKDDEWTSINDFDCYGRVEPAGTTNNTRPAEFDGAAYKVRGLYGDIFWWQPPLELAGISRRDWHRNAKLRAELRQQIERVLVDGFQFWTVEVCVGVDAYDDPIVRGYANIGGVEPVQRGQEEHAVFVLEDLIDEALGTVD